MRLGLFSLFLLFCAAALSTPSFLTFPSDIDWVARSSQHFDALFRRGQERVADRALRAAEKARRLLAPLFPELPPRTWIVLADFNDNLNGYALDVLYPHMVIFVAPPEPSGELATLDDWLDSVILHEYTHNLHLYPAGGIWKPIRFIFGSWVMPVGLAPSHFHEGLAVLTETEFTQGGRGRGPFFSMLRRMAVADKSWGSDDFFSADQRDGSSFRWPFGATSYFMGYQLYRELWQRQKAVGIQKLVGTAARTLPYFLNHPFETAFQSSYTSIWEKVFAETTLLEEKEIDRVSREGLSETVRLTSSRFSKWDLHLSPSGKIAAFRSYTPEHGSALEFWDVDKKTLVRRVDDRFGGVEGICFLGSETALLVSLQVAQEGYVNHELRHYDWESQTLSPLSGEPPRHLVTLGCSENGEDVVVYREKALDGELVWYRYDAARRELKVRSRWKTPEGTWVSGIVVKGGVWASLRRGTQTDFYRWNGKEASRARTADGHYHSLRPLDGEAFLAIGAAEGRNEIWIVDPTRNTQQKHAAVLGGVSSFDWKQKRLFALNYRHGGFELEKISPVSVPSGTLASASESSAKESPASLGETTQYSPWTTLSPRAWAPLFLFVPWGAQIGFWVPGFDISQRHYYDIALGYDTRGSAFTNLAYAYRFNRKRIAPTLYYSPNYLYVNDNLTLLSRGGGQITLDTSIGDFSAQLSAIYSRLFDARSDVGDLDSVGAGGGVSYSFGSGRPKPLDIAPRQGTSIALAASYYPAFLGSTQEYYVLTGRIDQYLPSPIQHHAFYASLRSGSTSGTEVRNSFFEVGGEILFAPVRPTYFNRGFSAARFAARQVLNANLEYRFPIAYVDRGIGLFPVKLRKIHAALVTDVTTVDPTPNHRYRDQFGKVYYASAGLELKSDWVLSYYFATHLRLGLYHGFGDIGEPLYFTMAMEAGF